MTLCCRSKKSSPSSDCFPPADAESLNKSTYFSSHCFHPSDLRRCCLNISHKSPSWFITPPMTSTLAKTNAINDNEVLTDFRHKRFFVTTISSALFELNLITDLSYAKSMMHISQSGPAVVMTFLLSCYMQMAFIAATRLIFLTAHKTSYMKLSCDPMTALAKSSHARTAVCQNTLQICSIVYR